MPRRIVALSTTTLSAGLAEAGVLVAVVRVAVGLADDSIGSVHVPFTDQTISDSDLLVAAAALAIANLLLHLVESRLKAALIADVYRGAREASILAFSRASWGRQSLEREGALQESVTSLTTQSANLMLTVVTLVTSTIHLAVLLLVAAFVDPIATVAVIAFGAVLFVALRPMARVTERNAGEWVKRNTSFAEEVTSLSSLAMELRVFGRHADARERLNELNDEVSETMRRMRVASGFGGTLYRDVALLLLVGAIGILLHLGDDAVLGFGIVALLILRSVASAQRVQSGLQSAREAAPAMRSLRQRISSLEDSAEPVRSARLEHLDTIRFDNATYRYPDDGPALTDFSLSIQKGEVLGVVGPSGSGKSTFAQLLLRLREPSSGRITIGDLDYTAITEEDWSRLVSLVPQEARLLEGSIADNIRFFRNGYSDAEVLATVRAAHLVDDLAKLPDGVRTALGPRGGGLSGGQRQRVTIARALLGRPELLVLDEPTSALDGRSEQLLNETIADLKATTTIVIIAHRLTTLKTCDRIAVFADGRLSQIGTRDELTNQPGFYQTVLAALAEG